MFLQTTLKKAAFFLAVVAAVGTFSAVWANHDDNPATEAVPRVLPYDGILNLDGLAFDGPADMRFSLYAAADGAEIIWSEDWDTLSERPVQVTAGRFSVNLGTFVAIEDDILDAGTLFLGIEVRAAGAEEWVSLGGRQRINPVPYAMWAASAADFTVAGNLDVRGDARIAGEATVVGPATVLGQTRLGGPLMVGSPDAWVPALTYGLEDQVLIVAPSGSDISAINTGKPLMVWGGAAFNSDAAVNAAFAFNSRPTFGAGMGVTGEALFNDSIEVNGVAILAAASVSGDVEVEQTLVVNGDVTLNDCRICLNFRQSTLAGISNRNVVCVQMRPGATSGYEGFDSDIGASDQVSLSFKCDGGNNVADDRNID